MDWTRAIEINRAALTRIVNELFAMLGIVSGITLGRMLRPAESALRRLIVIAAHGLLARPIVSRPMPIGLVIKSKGLRRNTTNTGANLSRRLTTLKHALETIPQQAIRLVRWQVKRAKLSNPKFTTPLRPGRPPGYRAKPEMEIDYILKECHALAWDSAYRNSS